MRISTLSSHWLACLLGLILLPAAAHAQGDDDKIDADRPDFVDASRVLGKGRWQLEGGYAVERDREAGVRERTGSTPLLLRYGATGTTELRVETEGRMRYRADGPGVRERERGWDDVTLGAARHLADGGGARPSLGVIADVTFATGSAQFRGAGVRPSLRAVAEWELPRGLSLGVMPGLVRDHAQDGRRAINGLLGISLGKDWSDSLHGFVELAAPRIARVRNGGTEATFDVGAAWMVSQHCQLDAAVMRGLNHRTADLAWTVGFSFRP
ncbi:transporter [Pseudoduganella armeniaca]|uniref:Transporter n=1 Tax=Pseudoduganella armeniaca TaxID=2072590 RepID=A0A2R4CE94_9BURK|nr:transporter [Pseudoduganella armeniaca]AVR97926.1 transporter [Pseudoduganella armeniaca]